MTKTLRAIDSFFNVDKGDELVYDENANMYTFKRDEEFVDDEENKDNECYGKFSASFSISPKYAEQLVSEGYLEEVAEKNANFVNIFDEIDDLLLKYNNEIKNLDTTEANVPKCIKVEKETVLNNMVTLLEHLKSLKK